MLTIRFEIFGDVVLARGLSRFGDAVRDLRPAWRQLLADFYKIETEQFKSQGGRAGAQWVPLSPDYAAWKEKWYPGRQILELTGQMKGEMTLGKGMFTELNPLSLRIIPRSGYAGIHQHGAPAHRLPPRPVVVLNEEDKMRWMKLIHNYVYDKAKEAHLA